MKRNIFSRTLATLLAILMVVGMIPLSIAANETVAEPETKTASDNVTYILYEENFDSYTTRVDLVDGTNDSGWNYSKKSTNGYAYIEGGKLYFAGSKYDVLYRAGGEMWGNYTVEADISYNTDNANWAGLAYNVQSDTKFQKASVAPGGVVGLNGYDAAYSGGWTNNDDNLNKTPLKDLGLSNSFALGQMRFKISVHNTSATLWIAQYTDGVLGSWIKAKEISNIYEDAQTGSIGFMSSNNTLGSIIVDNIKVYTDSLISFTEDFDAYEGTTLSVGKNGGADGLGIYFSKGQDKFAPTSYVKDGRLYLDARSTTSSYEHLYFMTGMNWTNYVVEMDYCEIGANGWIGMLYRVKEPFSFQKTGINFNGATSLYGFTGTAAAPQWQHNTAAPNKITQNKVIPTEGEPLRMKIVVNGQSATLYAARYNADGTVNAYQELTSASNLYAKHTAGSIGLMLCSGQAKHKAAWIDNVVVSRYHAGEIAPEIEKFTVSYVADGVTVDTFTVNAGGSVSAVPAVPAKEGYIGAWDHDGSNITADTVINAVYTRVIDPVVANIYLPQTGIINPPTVVQKITSALPATSGRTPAVALMEIDASLNIEGVNATVADFFASYINTVIPAFVVDSQAEADALIAYLNEYKIIDAFVVADSENAGLVKSVRQACPQVRGAIRFDAISDNQAVLNTVNENLAYVAISETPVALETVTYFHLRQRAVWCVDADTADMYQSIAAGWSGMISPDTDAVYDLYESITDITVTGQALPIAHRGEHITSPENTLEAFRSAVNNYGVLAVETDLRLTADGDLILDHDGSLDRTTDYENRKDEFTKGNLTSSYTVEELKQLNVDYTGGSYKLATFEEALAEFADEGLVFYAHINGSDDQIPAIVARLEELLEQYDAYDNVVFFISSSRIDAYNALKGTVTGKISMTAGDNQNLVASADQQECVENFINALAVNNYQPLFYNYGQHKGWNFYYKLSARGFVNSHSISNTQAYLDGIFLRDWGVVGALTDDINMTTSYVHKVNAEDSHIVAGQVIDTTYDLFKTVGVAQQAECNYIQLSGPEIVNGVMSQAGTAEVVFYTTCNTPSGGDYRVYSAPVTITAVEGASVEQWNISLRDDICPNFYLVISECVAENAVVRVFVGGSEVDSYNVQDLNKAEDGRYMVSVPVAAAQMADEIKLQIVAGEEELFVKTYTVAQYADTVLKNENLNQFHNLVKAMLNYGAKAQTYFEHNTNNLANAGYEITEPVTVPDQVLEITQKGSVEGISFYGASLVFVDKIAVRYYFRTSNDVTGYTFTANGISYNAVAKDGLYYVEIPGINPQDYQNVIELTVSDGASALTVGYSPMHYLTRMYNRDTTKDSLKNLLAAMYGYHLAADGSISSVNTNATLLLTEGYESNEPYAVLSANVKSLAELTYGWNNTVGLGVSGKDAWGSYGFQLAYGTSNEQNLVKLNDGLGYDGSAVMQEQWYNNAKLEAIFAEGGMDIKLIRMNTRAYLLADMGEGYELIGTMILPADAETLFSVYNNNTALKLSEISVETGKEATLKALNGIDLSLVSTGMVLPVDSDNWTVEGKLVINEPIADGKDYRMYAGATAWDQAVAILYATNQNVWYLQNQTNWSSTVLTEYAYALLYTTGLYVRFVRCGSTLTLWISPDGINWTKSLSHTGITENNIHLYATAKSQLLDVSVCAEAVFAQAKGTEMTVPGDYANASYAVMEANLKAIDAITYDWNCNINISPSGTVWDAYDFQIVFGTSSEQNLIKLTGGTVTADNSTAYQEQWINNPALEKLFSEDGLNVKAVRFNTWVYLLVDMGSGYELVGRMHLPADQTTSFTIWNKETALEIRDYNVQTGETAAAEAISGLNLTLDSNFLVLPAESDNWTLEGRLVLDTENFPWWQQDYRMYAGADAWDQAVSIFYSKSNVWYLQNHTVWSNAVIPDETWWMLSNQKGGMYVRFEKTGSTLTVSLSQDGVNWTTTLSHDTISAKGIYLYATLSSELRDVRLTIG